MKFQTRIAASVASVLLVAFASPSFAGQANAPITAVTPLPILDRSIQVGHADQFQQMYVTVGMPFADSAAMEKFAESVSDPNSPNYRHFITPEQVGERFGISQDRVQAISDYLQSQGLTVTMVAKNRLTVSCEGTLAQIETAFGTTIDQYVIDPLISKGEPDGGNAQFIAPSTDLIVPANIADDIISVSGLETYTKPEKRILTPTQTRALYNEAPLYAAGTQGQGRTIGISSWDGYRLTNVPLYYTKYALPTPAGGVGSNVHEVKISGGAGTGTVGGEADLDIQMVLGMAPLCEFYIYDGGASDLVGVLTREVNDNLCDVISESYGWSLSSSSSWTTPHNLHLSMTAQGITYMCASGDSGTTLGAYDYPNFDPEVLMVGGTTPVVNATTGLRTSEVGWSGSGGGWSVKAATFNKLPSWQVGTGVPTTLNYRLVPDLAFGANGTSGAYYYYLNGALTSGYTGTSFACPVFAGMLGVAQQKLIALGGLPADSAGKRRFGRIQNLLYSQNGRTDVWFDVISGSNGTLPNGSASSCTAKWDFVTGWGCMDINAFVTTQNPLFSITTPNGVPTLILPAGGTTMNVTITPITATVAAGSQKLFYKDSAASTWSSALLTSTGGYNYVATFPAASCNSTLQFYVQATSTTSISVTLPTGGASTPNSATAAISSTVVLSDDFDGASSAFTVGASGDTATAGTWVRSAVLSGCGANTVSYSGTKAWVTGSGGCVDVDGGKTSLLSPNVDATGADALDLSYAIFLSYNGGTPTDDPLQVFVSNDGGSTWVLAASYTTATGTNIWSLKKVSVLNYVGATNQMRVKFVAQDNGTDNVVEAGIDSVSFTSVVCNNTVYGDFNDDHVVDSSDVGLMLLDFGVCPGCPTDLDGSGEVDTGDVGLELLELN